VGRWRSHGGAYAGKQRDVTTGSGLNDDAWAGTTVSLFTMLVTLAMLGVGSVAETFGLRRAILGGLTIAVIGREPCGSSTDASP
jgi:hypothetical protein